MATRVTTTEKVPIVTIHVHVIAPNNIQTETVVQAPTTASSVAEETSFIEWRRNCTVSATGGSRVRPEQETNAMASAEMVGHQRVERNNDSSV